MFDPSRALCFCRMLVIGTVYAAPPHLRPPDRRPEPEPTRRQSDPLRCDGASDAFHLSKVNSEFVAFHLPALTHQLSHSEQLSSSSEIQKPTHVQQLPHPFASFAQGGQGFQRVASHLLRKVRSSRFFGGVASPTRCGWKQTVHGRLAVLKNA